MSLVLYPIMVNDLCNTFSDNDTSCDQEITSWLFGWILIQIRQDVVITFAMLVSLIETTWIRSQAVYLTRITMINKIKPISSSKNSA